MNYSERVFEQNDLYLNKKQVKIYSESNNLLIYNFLVKRFFKRIKLISNSNKLKILDVGCGPAKLSLLVKKKIPSSEIYALDSSPEMISLAKSKANRDNLKINFLQTDFENFKEKSNNFDIILFNLSFHELRNPEVILSKTRNLSNPSGYIEIFDVLRPKNFLDYFFMKIFTLFTKNDLKKQLFSSAQSSYTLSELKKLLNKKNLKYKLSRKLFFYYHLSIYNS